MFTGNNQWRREPLIAETLATLRAAGFEAQVEQSRKHFKIKFGKQLLVVSVTPSALSARANNKALVRRLIKREQSNIGGRS